MMAGLATYTDCWILHYDRGSERATGKPHHHLGTRHLPRRPPQPLATRPKRERQPALRFWLRKGSDLQSHTQHHLNSISHIPNTQPAAYSDGVHPTTSKLPTRTGNSPSACGQYRQPARRRLLQDILL